MYIQGSTNVTRMDYASPLSNELVFSLATERLLDIEVPDRAQWIRMLLVELNRISSHLLFQATNGMDLGAVSMMLYGWREREETLRVLEKITGLRMNHDFIRPGGVAADLPDGWQDDVLERVRARRARRRRLRHACSPRTRSGRSAPSASAPSPPSRPRPRRHRPDPALDRLRVGPAQGAAVPRVRRGRLRRRLHRERRRVRPLPDPAVRDRRVDQDRAPVRGEDAARRLPRAGPQGHAAAAGPDRRVDGSAHPPLQALHRRLPRAGRRDLRRRSSRRAARSGATSWPTAPRSRTGCTSAARRSTTCSRWVRWSRARWSPTRWRSSRASTRSWGRSTASAVHASQPRDRPRRSSRVPARSRRCSRCCTSRRTRTAGSRPRRSRRSPSCSTSRPRRCSGRAPSTRCSSASRSASSWCRCAPT